nr:uncharacterized protein LOC111413941 [Onthophagus taurus]
MSYPINPITKTELKAIYKNLGINEERHQRILEVFIDWIKCQPHLPDNIENGYYSNFLLLCKDDLAKTKEKFETNIIARKSTLIFNYDLELSMDCIEETNLARTFVPSKRLTAEGYRVIYVSLPKDPKHFDTTNQIKYEGMILDRLTMGEPFSGVVVVADFINCTSDILTKTEISVVMNFVHFYLQAIPQRLMHYHMINVTSFAKPIIAMVKSVMSEKLKKRFLFHDKPENVLDYLSKDFIPVQYGGTINIESVANEWLSYWKENNEWKTNLSKLKLTGEIPKGKLHLDQNSGFGTDGTFRNMQVD